MKKILKFLIPKFILRMKNKFIASRTRKEFLNKSQKDIFKTIYSKKMWAGEKEKKYTQVPEILPIEGHQSFLGYSIYKIKKLPIIK